MKKIIHSAGAGIVCAFLFSLHAAAAGYPWQDENEGLIPRPGTRTAIRPGEKLDRDRMPETAGGLGLNLRVQPNAAPEIVRMTGLRPNYTFSDHDISVCVHQGRSESSGNFGGITAGPALHCGLVSMESGWTRLELRLEHDCDPVESGADDADKISSLIVRLSRLTPAVLVETEEPVLTFFAGRRRIGAAGKDLGSASLSLAFPDKDSAKVFAGLEEPETVLAPGDKGAIWVLVWFGEGSPIAPLDSPMLIVTDNPFDEVELRHGMTLRSTAGLPLKAALVPLRGEICPGVQETAAWKDGLPEDVLRDCRWWAEHLKRMPLSVRESYTYDEASDTVTVTETFSDFFALAADAGESLLPLPAALALALAEGFPAEVKGELVDTPAITPAGPHRLVRIRGDSYSWTVGGLGKYARERPVPGAAANGAAGADSIQASLQPQLESEVRNMLEAGHLAPWYMIRNAHGDGWRNLSRFIFSNPGETVRALCMALPYLPDEMRGEVKEYLRRERSDYPPEQVTHTPSAEGARRERYLPDLETLAQFPTAKLTGETQYFGIGGDHWNMQNIYPEVKLIENAYALAEFAALVEPVDAARSLGAARAMFEPYLVRADWALLGHYRWSRLYELRRGYGETQYGFGGVADANQDWVGALGLVRLARMAGDKTVEQEAWGLLARASVFRFALGKWTGFLYRTGQLAPPGAGRKSGDRHQAGDALEPGQPWQLGGLITIYEGPQSDVRQVALLTEQGPTISVHGAYHNCAHLQTFLYIVPELGRFLGDFLKPECEQFMKAVDMTHPTWFFAMAPQQIGGGDIGYAQPMDGRQIFMARAWALGEPSAKLAGLLDVPHLERGDLYYIERLASTLAAYRGVEWR